MKARKNVTLNSVSLAQQINKYNSILIPGLAYLNFPIQQGTVNPTKALLFDHKLKIGVQQ